MSDNKKYYYLKLKESFFDSEEMKVLESMQNGIAYQNFYLKLCLLSLKTGGALLFKGTIPYDIQMLSTVLRMNIDTVKTGIELLQKFNLLEILDNGTVYMSDIQTLIGQSSTEAERIKLYRTRIKQEKQGEVSVTNAVQMYEHCTPEIEIEIDKEIDIDTVQNKPKKKREKKHFIPPCIAEIETYVREKNLVVDPHKFFGWYNNTDWKDNQNKPVANWKNKLVSWNARELERNPNTVPYFKKVESQVKKKMCCPRCGSEIIGGICTGTNCGVLVDANGKEVV